MRGVDTFRIRVLFCAGLALALGGAYGCSSATARIEPKLVTSEPSAASARKASTQETSTDAKSTGARKKAKGVTNVQPSTAADGGETDVTKTKVDDRIEARPVAPSPAPTERIQELESKLRSLQVIPSSESRSGSAPPSGRF